MLRIVMDLKTVKYACKYALKKSKYALKTQKICAKKLQNIYIKHHDCTKLLEIFTKNNFFYQ